MESLSSLLSVTLLLFMGNLWNDVFFLFLLLYLTYRCARIMIISSSFTSSILGETLSHTHAKHALTDLFSFTPHFFLNSIEK